MIVRQVLEGIQKLNNSLVFLAVLWQKLQVFFSLKA